MRNPLDRVPAPLLFLVAGSSQYLGAALAVTLFPLMPPHTVAWLRSVVAALILLVLVQPWRRQAWTLRTLTQSAVFGVVLMAMNMLFYIALEYLPLGAAVAIEFAGPVAVAAWGGRTLRQRIAIVLAAFGVVAISVLGLDWSGAESGWYLALGIACALAAGTAWAGYMVIGGRIVTKRDGISSLAVGTAAASLAFAPIAAPWAGPALQMDVIWLVLAVGVLTSVIPYTLDQVVLRRLKVATFALLNALLPATATVIGLLVLAQQPTGWELIGLAAISVAVALAGRRARTGPGPDTGELRTGELSPGETARATGGPVSLEPSGAPEPGAGAAPGPRQSAAAEPAPATGMEPLCDAPGESAAEPGPGPAAGSVHGPATGSVDEAQEPVAGPAPEPAGDAASQPAAEPATDPADSATAPASHPFPEPAAEPAAEPATGPGAEQSAEPEADSAAEPAAEPGADPATEPAHETGAQWHRHT